MITRLPDGSPAAGVPINMTVTVDKSPQQSWKGITDSDGAVYPVFNNLHGAQITVKVRIHELS